MKVQVGAAPIKIWDRDNVSSLVSRLTERTPGTRVANYDREREKNESEAAKYHE